MKSSSLLQRVATDLRLDENPEFQPRGWRAWLQEMVRRHPLPTTPASNTVIADKNVGNDPPHADSEAASASAGVASRIDEAASLLATHITAERVPLSYVVMISATSRDAKTAQLLATQLVRDYLADQNQISQQGLHQLAVWLRAKVAELQSKIADTGAAIERLKAQTGITGAEKGTFVEQQIADLNAQLMVVRANVADERARLEQAHQPSVGTDADAHDREIANSPTLTQLRLQASLLARQQAQLRERLGDHHSQVIAITEQLNNIRKTIADETATALADLQNSYDVAVRRERSIEANLDRLRTARGDSDTNVRLQEMQRNLDVDSKLYDLYLARLNEVETSETAGSKGKRVISPATVPSQPIFPQRKLILAGAAGFGLAIGVAVAFVANLLQAGMDIGVAAEQTFGYPAIGNIPFSAKKRALWPSQTGSSRRLLRALADEPLSPLSEAIRTIRISLRLSKLNNGPKVVVVTSSVPAEGKSTVASLLATSSAAAGQRTVLIDGDLRGRSISRDFGLPGPGLTDLLAGTSELSDVMQYDRETEIYIIPAGSTVRNASDLLTSPRLAETIATLRQDFDYLWVDTPPLLSAIDARAIATTADKILFVIDASHTNNVSVAEALRLLKRESHRIAGIVFNKISPEKLQHVGYYKPSIGQSENLIRLTGPG